MYLIQFFEDKDGLMRVVKYFIQTLTIDKQGAIKASDFDYYLDMTQWEMGGEFDDQKRDNPHQIGKLETSHYILNWLFDLL